MTEDSISSLEKKSPLAPKLVLVGALVLTPTYFFGIRSAIFADLVPLMNLLGIIAGCIGFLGLLIWNALASKRSFIAINTFFTIWMFLYFSLLLFFRG